MNQPSRKEDADAVDPVDIAGDFRTGGVAPVSGWNMETEHRAGHHRRVVFVGPSQMDDEPVHKDARRCQLHVGRVEAGDLGPTCLP